MNVYVRFEFSMWLNNNDFNKLKLNTILMFPCALSRKNTVHQFSVY